MTTPAHITTDHRSVWHSRWLALAHAHPTLATGAVCLSVAALALLTGVLCYGQIGWGMQH